jgi:hypothetical protein
MQVIVVFGTVQADRQAGRQAGSMTLWQLHARPMATNASRESVRGQMGKARRAPRMSAPRAAGTDLVHPHG